MIRFHQAWKYCFCLLAVISDSQIIMNSVLIYSKRKVANYLKLKKDDRLFVKLWSRKAVIGPVPLREMAFLLQLEKLVMFGDLTWFYRSITLL